MITGKLGRHLRAMRGEFGHLAGGDYPGFVTAAQPRRPRNEVPVFSFHGIDPERFEAQLHFLRVNGYHTITTDEFHAFVALGAPLPDGAVLLTMDDGRRSVWTHGFPLLRKYGMKATVFVIPGYVPERSDAPGDAPPGADADHADDAALVTWDELRVMHESGLVDIQSHTLHHHKVHVSDRIVGFHNPFERHERDTVFDLAVPSGYEPRVRARGVGGLWGMPIFENAPPMAGRPRYRADDGLVEECLAYVDASGGRDFFARRDWEGELRQLVSRWRDRHGAPPRLETPEEMQEELRANLGAARAMIEARLPGKAVRHLCYPYWTGSAASIAASIATGHVTNFWGPGGRASNRPGDDPFRCPRLKGDYIFRLPGEGRWSLARILRLKTARRSANRSLR